MSKLQLLEVCCCMLSQVVALRISYADTYTRSSSDQLLRLLMKACTAAVHPSACTLFIRTGLYLYAFHVDRVFENCDVSLLLRVRLLCSLGGCFRCTCVAARSMPQGVCFQGSTAQLSHQPATCLRMDRRLAACTGRGPSLVPV